MLLPEAADARPEEPPDLAPTRRDRAAGERQAEPDVELPPRAPRPLRDPELERGERTSRPDDARELPQRRARVVDVAEEVGEGERVEGSVLEGEVVGGSLHELDPLVEARGGDPPACLGQHLRALVEADHR